MPRILALDPATADGKSKELLSVVEKSLGVTPNMFRVAAHSQAALEGLLALNTAVAHGNLGVKTRERLALAIAEENRCSYCLSAHTFLGKRAGLSESEVEQARDGQADDPKAQAALTFAGRLIESRGHPDDAELAALRRAGFTDAEIIDVVAATALNIFTNYLNLTADTEVDFPVVKPATVDA